MPALLDFVALSLLPLHWQGEMASLLRTGLQAGDVLQRVTDDRAFDSCDRTALLSRARASLDRARDSDIQAIAWNDAAYPPALGAIADPPPVLWARGVRAALDRPAVAIVGSRAGSAYALSIAERLASDLAARGIAVVSGLARGVDSAAHRGALAAQGTLGTTLAVLGSGCDVIYPSEHRGLAFEIAASGLIVSELAPGTPPQPHFFPRRNRIISGLARAVVVIEAGDKSGSLITARCALEQGRDVLAVPGNVLNGRNRGGHALLRDGAKIVETADDILEELGMAGPLSCPETSRKTGTAGTADVVWDAIPAGDSCDLDALAERTGLAAARLLPRLFDLELRGLVRRVGGGRFVRVDRSC